MVEDALLAEMRALQEKVTGITGTAVASRDGLIVREDTGGVDPDNLAALAATWLALAQRMSTEVGQGTLREAMTRSSGGFVTIYAVGTQAVLVIIGDEGLDTAKLHRESQAALDAIRALLADNSPHAKAFLTEGERDRVQGEADARAHDRPVDADELQVASEQQFQLGRRLRRVPALDRPGDQSRQLVVELVGEPPRARLEHALKAFLQAGVGAEAAAARRQQAG